LTTPFPGENCRNPESSRAASISDDSSISLEYHDTGFVYQELKGRLLFCLPGESSVRSRNAKPAGESLGRVPPAPAKLILRSEWISHHRANSDLHRNLLLAELATSILPSTTIFPPTSPCPYSLVCSSQCVSFESRLLTALLGLHSSRRKSRKAHFGAPSSSRRSNMSATLSKACCF
jgi:hypothetical protein